MCLLPLYFHRQTPLHQLFHDHDRYCPEESPPKLTNRALVAFQWTFEGHGCSETFMQKMACKDAARRPVPFPKSWKTAIKVVTTIDRMRRDAIVEASRLIENPQCDCRLLGVPKPQEVLDELCGSLVDTRQAPKLLALCAGEMGTFGFVTPGHWPMERYAPTIPSMSMIYQRVTSSLTDSMHVQCSGRASGSAPKSILSKQLQRTRPNGLVLAQSLSGEQRNYAKNQGS